MKAQLTTCPPVHTGPFPKTILLHLWVCLALWVASAPPLNAQTPTCTPVFYGFGPGVTVTPVNVPAGTLDRDKTTLCGVYSDFLADYVTDAGTGAKRVLAVKRNTHGCNGQCTVSEQIAYAMLITVGVGDQAFFDAFLTYFQSQKNSRGLMHWLLDPNGTPHEVRSATDADLDIAYALILADVAWPGFGYKEEAVTLINNLYQYSVDSQFRLLPADLVNLPGHDPFELNPGYFSPAYDLPFSVATGESGWLNVRAKSYAILSGIQHPTTGLVPDWTDLNGQQHGEEVKDKYFHDAVRMPWRVGLDYLLTGSPNALTLLQKMETHIKNLHPDYRTAWNKTGAYNPIDRTQGFIGNSPNAAMISPVLVGMMATNDPAFIQEGWMWMRDKNHDDTFNTALKAISMLTISGHMPLPNVSTPPQSSLPDPLAYFPFTGNTEDAAGTHNLINIGAQPAPGHDGTTNGAYTFNGTGNYMKTADANNAFDNQGAFSASIWIKPTLAFNQDTPLQPILEKGELNNTWWESWGLQYFQGSIRGFVRPAQHQWQRVEAAYPIDLQAGQWTHLGLTYTENDGIGQSALTLYVNGAPVSTSHGPAQPSSDNGDPLRVGFGGWTSPAYHFSGTLDELAFWPTALTGEDVLKIYQGNALLKAVPAPPPTARLHTDVHQQAIPATFSVGTPYPNPFAGHTTLPLQLTQDARVQVRLYDVQGKLRLTRPPKTYEAGTHLLHLEGDLLPTGTYLIVLQSGSQTYTSSVTRIR